MTFSLLLFYAACLLSVTGDKTDNPCKGEPGCLSPNMPALCPPGDPNCQGHVVGATDKYIVRDPVDDVQPPEDDLFSLVGNPSVVVTVIIRVIKVMAVLNFVILFLWVTLFAAYQALGFFKETEQLPV